MKASISCEGLGETARIDDKGYYWQWIVWVLEIGQATYNRDCNAACFVELVALSLSRLPY